MLLQWYVAGHWERMEDADGIVDIPVSGPLPTLVPGLYPERKLHLPYVLIELIDSTQNGKHQLV